MHTPAEAEERGGDLAAVSQRRRRCTVASPPTLKYLRCAVQAECCRPINGGLQPHPCAIGDVVADLWGIVAVSAENIAGILGGAYVLDPDPATDAYRHEACSQGKRSTALLG